MSASDDAAQPQLNGEDEQRRARRERARTDRRRRHRRLAVLVPIAVVAVVVLAISSATRRSPAPRLPALAGAAGSTPTSPTVARRTRASPFAATATTTRTPAPPRRSRPASLRSAAAPSPGALPQTHAYPSARSKRFKTLMASLWAGIVHDSLARALPAFFPKGAYVQLKAIASASSDWRERLVHDYRMDIDAAHAQLGSSATHAALIAVKVTASYGHWVAPGVCDNGIGYYEMPNARVVYRLNGQIRSFAIASMISWRGEWYVVHLGAILRAADVGMVDEPASGPGTSAYSSTC
jgi:hypothetical protein